MDDDARPAEGSDADESPLAAETQRAAAIGFALLRAKHDLNNLFHVARGWSRLLKDPHSGVHQTQEGIDAVLAAAEQTSDLINGILALGARATANPAIVEAAPAQREPNPRENAAAIGAPSSVTVLLVDDHRDVRRLATTMLERAGYQVLTASDAEEARVTSQSFDGPIHLLCCDAQMPGLPVLQLIAELCSARPTLKVLVCTGERPQGKLAEFPRLSKPFSYQQLVTAARSCLE